MKGGFNCYVRLKDNKMSFWKSFSELVIHSHSTNSYWDWMKIVLCLSLFSFHRLRTNSIKNFFLFRLSEVKWIKLQLIIVSKLGTSLNLNKFLIGLNRKMGAQMEKWEIIIHHWANPSLMRTPGKLINATRTKID